MDDYGLSVQVQRVRISFDYCIMIIRFLHRCRKTVSRHSGSNTTSNLVKHMKMCSPRDNVQPQRQQLMNAFASGSMYKCERLCTLAVCWVTSCRRPMSIVSDPEFLDIIKMLNPQAEVPSRNNVTQDIKTMYSMAKANLKIILRVS